jgi:two-component system sensor histidine kinase RegB
VDGSTEFLALAASAGLVVHVLKRITGALARRDDELRRVREQRIYSETLVLVARRAVVAARELSMPLATIAAAAEEMEGPARRDVVIAEARRIREQIERCRAILSGLRAPEGSEPSRQRAVS